MNNSEIGNIITKMVVSEGDLCDISQHDVDQIYAFLNRSDGSRESITNVMQQFGEIIASVVNDLRSSYRSGAGIKVIQGKTFNINRSDIPTSIKGLVSTTSVGHWEEASIDDKLNHFYIMQVCKIRASDLRHIQPTIQWVLDIVDWICGLMESERKMFDSCDGIVYELMPMSALAIATRDDHGVEFIGLSFNSVQAYVKFIEKDGSDEFCHSSI